MGTVLEEKLRLDWGGPRQLRMCMFNTILTMSTLLYALETQKRELYMLGGAFDVV